MKFFSIQRRNLYKLNEKVLFEMIVKINPNKKNYLYLDWPFGKYIFEEMQKAEYKDINLIKFSLFELFNFSNRFELWEKWNANSDYIRKKLIKIFAGKQINGLLVTLDWVYCFNEIIDIFHKINIPTYCIIHEAVFQDENIYYNSKKPISDKVLTWGKQTKKIFEKRGYPKENIYSVGSIKLNSYKSFKPKLTKCDFLNISGLDKNKKTILYCCQLCDWQWGDQNYALTKQREVISDLVKIAKDNNYNLIVRNAPANPSKILPNDFVEQYDNLQNVFIDGKDIDNSLKSIYKTNPDDTIFYSDILVGMNTTMQLEASVLNKPSIVVKYFEFDAKWHSELGLPLCTNYSELEKQINDNINSKHNLIDLEKKQKIYDDYGYSDDINYNPLKNIEEILLNIKKETK